MISILDLQKILRLKGNAVSVPTKEDWEQFEAAHNKLPPDYKAFLSLYGSGIINGFLYVLNPFNKGRADDWLQRNTDELAGLRELRDECRRDGSREYSNWQIYPEPSGLLLWGLTIDGDALYWKTKGAPDEWTVVSVASRTPDLIFHDGDKTISFLIQIIKNPNYTQAFRMPAKKTAIFEPNLFL